MVNEGGPPDAAQTSSLLFFTEVPMRQVVLDGSTALQTFSCWLIFLLCHGIGKGGGSDELQAKMLICK